MNELSFLDNMVNGLMNGGCDYGTYTMPDVDVTENKDGYTLQMDLPGRTQNDVALELEHGTLTVSSVKKEEKHDEKNDKDGSRWLIRERSTADFRRSFSLPEDVNSDMIAASFSNGVLTVKMPRKAETAAKKIAIEAA